MELLVTVIESKPVVVGFCEYSLARGVFDHLFPYKIVWINAWVVTLSPSWSRSVGHPESMLYGSDLIQAIMSLENGLR